MTDFAERIFALSPNKLELLARRLRRQLNAHNNIPASQVPRTSEANAEPLNEGLKASDEEILGRLDEMSDVDVDALLTQLMNDGKTAAGIGTHGTDEEMLARLHELSDEQVNSLLDELSRRENT